MPKQRTELRYVATFVNNQPHLCKAYVRLNQKTWRITSVQLYVLGKYFEEGFKMEWDAANFLCTTKYVDARRWLEAYMHRTIIVKQQQIINLQHALRKLYGNTAQTLALPQSESGVPLGGDRHQEPEKEGDDSGGNKVVEK